MNTSAVSLRNCSQDELLKLVSFHVREEKKFTLLVLEDLLEIDRRKLFAERGFSSLHEFCVKYLGYSDGAAARRIKSMRLMSEVPEVKTAIADNSISLSMASTLQCFFESEKRDQKKVYSKEEKQSLVESVKGMSHRQTEKVLAGISPKSVSDEKTRVVTATDTEISFTVTDEFLSKLKRLKELSSAIPEGSYAKAFEWMMDKMLKELEPKQPKEPKIPAASAAITTTTTPTSELARSVSSLINERAVSARSIRYIPQNDKCIVWKKDHGQCSFIDPITKRRCSSRYRLQYDHRMPFAKGGATQADNLQLLCHAHNQLRARRAYGKEKIPRPSYS